MTPETVTTVLTDLLKIGASPGGLALLANLFTDHGITPEKVAEVVRNLPDPPNPKE